MRRSDQALIIRHGAEVVFHSVEVNGAVAMIVRG